MQELRLERIETEDALLGIESDWRQLELESCCTLPFQTFDWTAAWWRHMPEKKLAVRDRLFVHVVRDAVGRCVAVAPMIIAERPGIGPIRLRELQFLGPDPNMTEMRGLLALPEYEEAAHRSLLAHLRVNARDWDWLVYSGVPRNDNMRALPSHYFSGAQFTGEVVDNILVMPDSWQAFKAKLPRNIKESLRKCYNSLKRDELAYELVVVQEREGVRAALAAFFRLHAARADADEMPSHNDVFASAKAQRFLVELCERYADNGILRIFVLKVQGNAAAVRIGFAFGDALYLYYSGFDPALGKYSIMTTAVSEALQYAIREGFRTVNLSTGTDKSKTRWRPTESRFDELRVTSPSLRGTVANEVYQRVTQALHSDSPRAARIRRLIARRA